MNTREIERDRRKADDSEHGRGRSASSAKTAGDAIVDRLISPSEAGATNSSQAIFSVAAMLGVFAVGALDLYTGAEASFSIFYVLPIFLATWRAGKRIGYLLSVLSGGTCLAIEVYFGAVYTNPLIPYWNALVRFAFFLLIARLLAEIKDKLAIVERISEADPLTGAYNSRAFYKLAEKELQRSARFGHPLSLAYFDVDNFKVVNDSYGHEDGDLLLRQIISSLIDNTRKTDVIARLGGDEFAILLPETSDRAAQAALENIKARLLERMKTEGWPVTFSFGAVTFEDVPNGVQEMIRIADAQMYQIKRNGKNGIAHSVWTSSPSDKRE